MVSVFYSCDIDIRIKINNLTISVMYDDNFQEDEESDESDFDSDEDRAPISDDDDYEFIVYIFDTYNYSKDVINRNNLYTYNSSGQINELLKFIEHVIEKNHYGNLM